MSNNEPYEHYGLRVPKSLLKLSDELCVITIEGEPIKVHDRSDVMREALLKGLKLMLMERIFLGKLMGIDASKNAKSIHAHLEKTAKDKRVAVDNDKGVPA